ncbi:hypothetical protein [Blastococcus sp. SYSU DS1024]
MLAAICLALGPVLPELLGTVPWELATRRPRLEVRCRGVDLAA